MLYVGIADQKDQLFWPKSGMERNCPVLNNWVTNPYPYPVTFLNYILINLKGIE